MRRAFTLLLLVALPVSFGVPAAAAPRPAPRLALWMEVSANLPIFASRERLVQVLDRAKAAGITDLIPEAKNAWGYVLYESAFAPHIRDSPVPRPVPPTYDAPAAWFPRNSDPFRIVLEEAHARGLRVHAAVNVFGEGLNTAGVGRLFERPEWRAQHLAPDGRLIPATEVGVIGFANPLHPEVQLYELAIVQEIVSRYDVDGVVLDRLRFPDGSADFSALSRIQFEEWLGQPVGHWPEDVLVPNGSTLTPGPLFAEWVAWRAQAIRQFVRAAATVVRAIRPEATLSAYVGGWYPTYWQEGTNWAVPEATPDLPWVTPSWKEASIAEFLDFLMPGLYYPAITSADALRSGASPWMSVEGAALMAKELLAGGPPPVGALLLTLYEDRPEQFGAALETVLRLHGAAMLFDLVYLERYGWWDILRTPALATP
ncbi:MAG: alpha amylase family protein [Armatimonadota bacterium]|nr:alpha amylase family protein [Armatimonadota bacterium]MDR7450930.1 alpha amylase family protein [Armatimonadota bacterium]MDR7465852.1 alpha amylase family protein [Armatimonadota bacterium]MDR7493760.1 alpha amylase family protein [Armatimonadota bacterium]MDR7498366.1 alpha amylase family protein [Armatimonadota bacterium]